MKNLINLSGGDRLNLRVQGQILISESVKNGKTRQTQKEFASTDEAQKACAKKEWESLKKGYVLQNADAKAGEASLHVYIGGGYTGALAFAGVADELFVYKCGGYKEGGALDDFLIRLDASGAVKQQIVLQSRLHGRLSARARFCFWIWIILSLNLTRQAANLAISLNG